MLCTYDARGWRMLRERHTVEVLHVEHAARVEALTEVDAQHLIPSGPGQFE